MRPDQLFSRAQGVAQKALKRADADVNGTTRAQARYEAMNWQERYALEKTVKQRYGDSAWDDFMRAIGKGSTDA